jgi:hypothetical protein
VAGRLVLGGFAAAAIVGIDTNRTVAYQAFAFLAAVLAIALAASRWSDGCRATAPRASPCPTGS